MITGVDASDFFEEENLSRRSRGPTSRARRVNCRASGPDPVLSYPDHAVPRIAESLSDSRLAGDLFVS